MLKKILRRVRKTSKKNLVVASAFMVALAGAISLGVATKQTTLAATGRDCSTNSIDYKNMNGGCGATTPSEFIKDVKANSPSDLKAIYENYGLAPSEYERFVKTARPGIVYKDGRVVVDGQTVATDAWSVGRHNWSGRKAIKIAGKTYYTSPTKVAFASNSLHAMVMFNDKGKMEFAVITECGNPVPASPETPTYACNALNKKTVDEKKNIYSFTTNASAGKGANIVKVEYDFGDGSPKVTKSSPSDAVTHTFTKSATVSVKVYVSLPGKQTTIVESVKCRTNITVTPPAPKPEMSCDQLKLVAGKVDDKGNTDYTLTANASVKNATIQSYLFTFGDNGSKTVTTGATSATATHTYAPGTYIAKVSVNVLADGKTQVVTGPKCVGSITVKPLECKPGVPVGSPECLPQPEMACVQLALAQSGTADVNGNIAYKLTATASAKNAVIQSYAFNFGDQTQNAVVPSAETTASVIHTYAPGTYTAKVTVTMVANDKTQEVTSANCMVPVTVNELPKCTVPGKENLPPDSPECKETPKVCTAPNGQTYPEGSAECNPAEHVLPAATELPKTGAGGVIGIFAGTSALGAAAHAVISRRRKS